MDETAVNAKIDAIAGTTGAVLAYARERGIPTSQAAREYAAR
ncbi:hypothetical protein [Amycolatopsis silviterrae]|uniref:Uncharacterized protein n=1 Tax=Amycolatopsis silviterrae TaxID=1656914 RepID=A0ABW5H2P5_9PSEU